MTYPEDIMQAAREHLAQALKNFSPHSNWGAYLSGQNDQDYDTQAVAYAIAAERARHQWQPIETAPKDGTRILMRGGSIEVPDCNKGADVPCSARWDGDDWLVDDERGEYYWALYRGATEWKPIEPPQKASLRETILAMGE